MPKVSVIIPVYNTEKYLRKCLDSVCAQTLEDIEIICVNDCSPDASLEILKEYASKDNRIRIIDFKENKGVSVARNIGIDNATGEYIAFMDSDDWIELDFYEKLYGKSVHSTLDIVKGQLDEFIIETSKFHHDVLNINENIQKTNNKLYFCTHFTSAIYKSSIIKLNNLKFCQKLKNGEDGIFLLDTILCANKICIENDVTYYYCRHDDSANAQILNDTRFKDLLSSYEIIFNKLNNIEEYSTGLDFIYNFYLSNCIKLVCRNNNKDHKENALCVALQCFKNFKYKKGIINYLCNNYPILVNGFINDNIEELCINIFGKSYNKFISDNFRYKLKQKRIGIDK